MKGKAFFDFDGTLVKFDSFIKFAWHSLSPCLFVKGVIMSLPWLSGWKLRMCSGSIAKERLFYNWFKGWDLTDFNMKCKEFVPIIDAGIKNDIMAELASHQNAHHEIIIVSASLANWIEPWAILHSIDRVIATEPEVTEDRKLTGKFRTPNCLGIEKVKRILRIYPDLKEYESWAYSDSDKDSPLLAEVSHGFKVK